MRLRGKLFPKENVRRTNGDIFTDDRSVPIIEIEPIPKGHKKNKTFSLFKVWKVKPTDPSSDMVVRVAARWVNDPSEEG